MLDLDNIIVNEECVMMCTDVQFEDADKNVVVYEDQGINTEEYEKAMYGLTENVAKDTSKGSLFDCQENASHYTYYCLNNQCEY